MPRGRVAPIARFVACICAFTACGGDGRAKGTDTGFSVRDSAGVAIAENSIAEPAEVPWWRIDTTPSFTIGVTEGDTAYQFGTIRGLSVLPNGVIVVLNGRGELTSEFRFFDSTGKHLGTHGRLGEGPGEFRRVSFFGWAGGDTMIAVDSRNSRLSWVSASAGYVRSVPLDENGFRKVLGDDAAGVLETMVPLGDSVYAVKAYRRIVGAVSRAQRSETFHIVDMKAGTGLNVAHFDDPPLRELQLTSGRTYLWPAGAGTASHVVDDERERLCATITRATEIVCVDSAGKRRMIRWATAPVPYTNADRDSLERELRATPASRSRTEQDLNALLAATERPENHLPFTTLALDSRGNFWILEPAQDSAGKRISRFRVLDPEGRTIAFADGFPVRPYRSRTLHIDADRVLRVIENADGAEVVGAFAIRKQQ